MLENLIKMRMRKANNEIFIRAQWRILLFLFFVLGSLPFGGNGSKDIKKKKKMLKLKRTHTQEIKFM